MFTAIELINIKNDKTYKNKNLYESNSNKQVKKNNKIYTTNSFAEIYKYNKIQMERNYNLNLNNNTNNYITDDTIPLCELVPLCLIKQQLLRTNKQKIE